MKEVWLRAKLSPLAPTRHHPQVRAQERSFGAVSKQHSDTAPGSSLQTTPVLSEHDQSDKGGVTSLHSDIQPPKKSRGHSRIGAYAFLVSSSPECPLRKIPQTRQARDSTGQTLRWLIWDFWRLGGWGPSLQPQELKGPCL